jgi:uncharacterized membrane protein
VLIQAIAILGVRVRNLACRILRAASTKEAHVLSGWKTYLGAIGIGLVGLAAALGWITEDLRNTLLVFLNALVAGTLRAGVKKAETKAADAAQAANAAAMK